jgi:hypothetical protein
MGGEGEPSPAGRARAPRASGACLQASGWCWYWGTGVLGYCEEVVLVLRLCQGVVLVLGYCSVSQDTGPRGLRSPSKLPLAHTLRTAEF